MSEFKTIPIAPKYEINKEGTIQTVDKKTPIFPYPMGSGKVRLTMGNGVRKEFEIGALVYEAFMARASAPNVAIVGNQNGVVGSVGQCSGAPIGVSSSDMEARIMSLDTFTSVKIWKLHESGIKEGRIRELVGPKNQANVANTIKNFKKSETLRAKSDKVKM